MPTKIELANKYLEHRINGDIDKIIELLSDDIVKKTIIDGTHRGIEGLRKYYTKTPFQGTWNEFYHEEENKVSIRGKVYRMYMNWNVKMTAHFDEDNKIREITQNLD